MTCTKCSIELKKKESYTCTSCGTVRCGKHIYQYVDESNEAITKNSPELCDECYRTSLGDIYHELRVALHKYAIGEITAEAYNAKIEEMQKFLESIKV